MRPVKKLVSTGPDWLKASSFLCTTVGIDNALDNSAAYISGWSKALRAGKRLVITGASLRLGLAHTNTHQKRERTMKVMTVNANIRYTQDTRRDASKVVEIRAKASVDEMECRSEALAHLYSDLGRELKTLWAANGNVHKATEAAHDSAESTIAAPRPMEQLSTNDSNHYRQQQDVPFREYSRGDSRWYGRRRW